MNLPRLILAVLVPSIGAFLFGDASERSSAVASELPHAVVVDDGTGKKRHLHIASLVPGGVFTSAFGLRRHPMGGGGVHHDGLDIAAPEGTPIRAAAGGVIADIGWRGSYGRFILIRHSDNLETAYAHLSRFARGLKPGRRVKQDQIIGHVGTTGRSTGPHLHFEIRHRGRPIDPLLLTPAAHGR
jgi:murein DD-endopeptidase MepM/ murein hydrolase activator NlpD